MMLKQPFIFVTVIDYGYVVGTVTGFITYIGNILVGLSAWNRYLRIDGLDHIVAEAVDGDDSEVS